MGVPGQKTPPAEADRNEVTKENEFVNVTLEHTKSLKMENDHGIAGAGNGVNSAAVANFGGALEPEPTSSSSEPRDEVDSRDNLMRSRNRLTGRRIRQENFSEEMMKQMVELMRCLICGIISPPSRRFICNKGHHHFCYACGKKRTEENGALCAVLSGNRKGEDIPGENEPEKQSCQGKLKPVTDPIYTALFNTMTMKCPMAAATGTCSEVIKGSEYIEHVDECLKKFARSIGISEVQLE